MHVFGMAKAQLDLVGAKRRSLELDFLRLAYAVRRVTSLGDEACGYILVVTHSVADTVKKWMEKYGTEDSVIIIEASLTNEELRALQAEKERNKEGMLSGMRDENVDDLSNADYARTLGEGRLIDAIRKRHPTVEQISDEQKFTLGVKWDFYGVVGQDEGTAR